MKAPRGEWLVKIVRRAAGSVLAAAAVFSLLSAMVGPAIADQLQADCQQTGDDKRHLQCDVRFVTPRQIDTVAATVAETGLSLQSPYTLYPNSGDLSAFLFLFDVGDPARTSSLSANVADAQRIMRSAAAQDRFGVAVFPGSGRGPDPSVDVLAGIGSDPNSLERSLASVRAKGTASSTYLSSIEAIRLLATFPAKRRALFLFAAAKAQGESFTLDNVVGEAAKAGVIVFPFGIKDRAADLRPLEPLARLADRTGGRYFVADLANPHFTPADLDTTLKHIDNGARVTVDLAGVNSDQTVELTFKTTGSPSSLIHRVTVQGLTAGARDPAKPQTDKPGTTSPSSSQGVQDSAEKQSSTPPGWIDKAKNWIWDNSLVSGVAGVGVALLLSALIAYRVSRRGRRRMDDAPLPVPSSRQETVAVRSGVAATTALDGGGGGSTLATLQPVVTGGSTHTVRRPMVTIGRAPDCDIRLSDETVSAHHATLVHKRDGSFELTDMGSRNGVRVNGERVERRNVSNGDKIELGAVQFRFVLN